MRRDKNPEAMKRWLLEVRTQTDRQTDTHSGPQPSDRQETDEAPADQIFY